MPKTSIIISSVPYQFQIDEGYTVSFVSQHPDDYEISFNTAKGVLKYLRTKIQSWFIASLITYKYNFGQCDMYQSTIIDSQVFNSTSDNGIIEFIKLLKKYPTTYDHDYRFKFNEYYNNSDDENVDENEYDTSDDEEEEEDEEEDDEEEEDEDDNKDKEDDNNDNNDEERENKNNKEGKYSKDDIYDDFEFDKWQGSLAVYFTNNIYDKMEPVDCCPTSYSNEIELGTGDNDYRLYFYVYNRNKNCLLLSEGTCGGESYFEHSQLLKFLEEEFGSPFKCIDFENKKVYERKNSVTVERNLLP